MYLLGLPFCTRGGQYWIEIFDKYSGGWAILIVGALECICIGWVYGHKNFHKDIELMIGNKCSKNKWLQWYWSISWMYISPALLVLLILFSFIQYKPLRTDDYIFPYWANLIGWLLSLSVLSGIIFWTIYCLIDSLLYKNRTFKSLFKPESDWGPLRMEHKRMAVHLANLEPYHDSKRIKKTHNVSTISIS